MSSSTPSTNGHDDDSGITRKFLEDILGKKIESFVVQVGSQPGDNFTSVLYAIHVLIKNGHKEDDEEEELHLLCKTYPTLASRQKFLNETNLFSKEIKVYKEYIPELLKFQDKICPTKIIRPAVPPFLAGHAAIDFSTEKAKVDDDHQHPLDCLQNFLLMIDIRKTLGYRMVEKRMGLDFAHCALVIEELARTHALGWSYKRKMGLDSLNSKFPFFVETCFHRSRTEVVSLLESNFNSICGILEMDFGSNLRVIKAIEKLRQITPFEILSSFIPDDGWTDEKKVCSLLSDVASPENGYVSSEPWVVALHGDSWVNNFMFKYADPKKPGTPTDLMLVDLQMYREGCPTTDLSYMFSTSTTYDFRKAHLNNLLSIYHVQFVKVCETLDVELPPNFTFANLQSRYKRSKIFGFVASCLVLPIILSSEDSIDLDTVKGHQVTKEGEEVKHDDMDDAVEGKLSDLFRTLTNNLQENQLLRDRFVGMVKEMLEDNIF